MTSNTKPAVPLARCRVLYIGRAAPMKHPDGLQAAQKPLHELYTKDHSDHRHVDTDLNLIAFNNGVLMQQLDHTGKKTWLPIKNLEACFAVKPTELDEMGHQFAYVPVDSPDSSGSQHPPIFACIFRRNDGIPVADCYAFVCKSDMAALALVQSCIHAHANQDGVSDEMPHNEPPPPQPKATFPASTSMTINTNDRCPPPAPEMTDICPPEYYEKPPLHGYFYSPRPNLIHKFAVIPREHQVPAPQPALPPPAPAPAPIPQVNPTNQQNQQAMMYPGQQMYPMYPGFQMPEDYYPYPGNYDPCAPDDCDDDGSIIPVPIPVPYYYAENEDPTTFSNNQPATRLRRYYDDDGPEDSNSQTYLRQVPVDDRDYMPPMNDRTYDRYIPQDSRYNQYPNGNEDVYSRRLPTSDGIVMDPAYGMQDHAFGPDDCQDLPPGVRQFDGNFILKRPNRPYV